VKILLALELEEIGRDVQFTPLNYGKNPIFNFKLQNWIKQTIQLSKPAKFSPFGCFEGGFLFYKNLKYSNLNKKIHN